MSHNVENDRFSRSVELLVSWLSWFASVRSHRIAATVPSTWARSASGGGCGGDSIVPQIGTMGSQPDLGPPVSLFPSVVVMNSERKSGQPACQAIEPFSECQRQCPPNMR